MLVTRRAWWLVLLLAVLAPAHAGEDLKHAPLTTTASLYRIQTTVRGQDSPPGK